MNLKDLPNKIPIFPLSNFIIFPKTDVPLKIELLDKAGVPVYTQPVQYGETYPSLPYRYISVEVYPPPVNIPGEAELVILGELNDELVDVEQRFRGAYNVKFSKIVLPQHGLNLINVVKI